MTTTPTTTLPQGMFPTLAETFGDTFSDTFSERFADARDAQMRTMRTRLANAIDDAIAAHELIDTQRARIAEQDALIATLKAHLNELAPLAARAEKLAQELRDESAFCDLFRDEAIINAAHLAEIDRLTCAVGIERGTTIDRVNTLISLWLSAEARAQGLNIIISNVSGADSRCDAPASAGDAPITHRDAARG